MGLIFRLCGTLPLPSPSVPVSHFTDLQHSYPLRLRIFGIHRRLKAFVPRSKVVWYVWISKSSKAYWPSWSCREGRREYYYSYPFLWAREWDRRCRPAWVHSFDVGSFSWTPRSCECAVAAHDFSGRQYHWKRWAYSSEAHYSKKQRRKYHIQRSQNWSKKVLRTFEKTWCKGKSRHQEEQNPLCGHVDGHVEFQDDHLTLHYQSWA